MAYLPKIFENWKIGIALKQAVKITVIALCLACWAMLAALFIGRQQCGSFKNESESTKSTSTTTVTTTTTTLTTTLTTTSIKPAGSTEFTYP